MVGEHNGRRLVKRNGDEAGCPCWAGGNGVGSKGNDVAGEAFEGLVKEEESDGGGVGRDDGPVALIVADSAAVESVVAHVVVLGDVGGHALDGEGAIPDAVCIAADYGT